MEIHEKAFSKSNVIGCIVLRKSVEKLQFFIQTTKRTIAYTNFQFSSVTQSKLENSAIKERRVEQVDLYKGRGESPDIIGPIKKYTPSEGN